LEKSATEETQLDIYPFNNNCFKNVPKEKPIEEVNGRIDTIKKLCKLKVVVLYYFINGLTNKTISISLV